MKEWQAEAKTIGLSMRLSSHRNSTHRENPAEAAGTYALTITAEDRRNPTKQLVVQFLCEWAKAASRRPVPAEPELPWNNIIRWWGGQECVQFR